MNEWFSFSFESLTGKIARKKVLNTLKTMSFLCTVKEICCLTILLFNYDRREECKKLSKEAKNW